MSICFFYNTKTGKIRKIVTRRGIDDAMVWAMAHTKRVEVFLNAVSK